jgi:hypothetical protein
MEFENNLEDMFAGIGIVIYKKLGLLYFIEKSFQSEGGQLCPGTVQLGLNQH